MPGIVIGIDCPRHSHFALEWAIRYAALRQLPLTVITVLANSTPGWAGTMLVSSDEKYLIATRDRAQDAVAKAGAELGTEVPPSVLVQAYLGVPAEILIRESQVALAPVSEPVDQPRVAMETEDHRNGGQQPPDLGRLQALRKGGQPPRRDSRNRSGQRDVRPARRASALSANFALRSCGPMGW